MGKILHIRIYMRMCGILWGRIKWFWWKFSGIILSVEYIQTAILKTDVLVTSKIPVVLDLGWFKMWQFDIYR